ncbi:MAG: hypothetical protein KAY59_09350 [Acidobacteria bacterium]|jgi:hypothetical protein|nr:hypothetical protein [Acidobacteriota bacterium]
MAKKAQKSKKSAETEVAAQVETYVTVQGYSIAQVLADRSNGDPVALIRLLRKQSKKAIDVGYVLFFADDQKLPSDWVQNAETNMEAIIMHAHSIDYERILDMLRNEDVVRLCFSGPSVDDGIAELRSLRENF